MGRGEIVDIDDLHGAAEFRGSLGEPADAVGVARRVALAGNENDPVAVARSVRPV